MTWGSRTRTCWCEWAAPVDGQVLSSFLFSRSCERTVYLYLTPSWCGSRKGKRVPASHVGGRWELGGSRRGVGEKGMVITNMHVSSSSSNKNNSHFLAKDVLCAPSVTLPTRWARHGGSRSGREHTTAIGNCPGFKGTPRARLSAGHWTYLIWYAVRTLCCCRIIKSLNDFISVLLSLQFLKKRFSNTFVT